MSFLTDITVNSKAVFLFKFMSSTGDQKTAGLSVKVLAKVFLFF